MRENWTYKKLGEVCEIYQPKTLSTEDLVADGDYPVYGANGIIGRFNSYNHEFPEVLLTCRGATCGRINISQPFSWINGNAMVIHRKSDDLSFDFLKYVMFSLDYSLIITGAAQPQITRQKLAPTVISYPSLSEQQAIVSELDKINELISLKKAQLSDLDALAQSIFYDMFGDPIENEKGWEVKVMKEVCSKITDGTHDTPTRLTEGVKFITGKHIRPFYIDYDNSDYVTEEVHREIYARCNPEYDDVLYTNIGAGVANAAVNKVQYEFSMKNVALLKLHKEVLSSNYLVYYLNNSNVKNNIIESFSSGGAQVFLSLKAISKILIPLPSLALQQDFAKRIELIEQQKAQISSTIKDLETLLASRMQYWFD